MNIKDLSINDLALLLSMQFFMCDVDLYNYKDLYDQMSTLDNDSYTPSDFDVWEPFENYPHESIMSEIDSQKSWLLETLETYVSTDNQ